MSELSSTFKLPCKLLYCVSSPVVLMCMPQKLKVAYFETLLKPEAMRLTSERADNNCLGISGKVKPNSYCLSH